MKTISEFLSTKVEKVPEHFELNSYVTDNPIEINEPWLVSSYYWKPNRVSIFIEYVTEILKEQLLTNQFDIDFAENWLRLAKYAYKCVFAFFPKDKKIDSQDEAFMYLFNGERPRFGYAKFTYDVLRYALQKPDLTIPRKQKLEKILRDCYQDVEENKNKMNWYNL